MKQRVNLRSPLFIQYASRPAEGAKTNEFLRSPEIGTSPNTGVGVNVIDNTHVSPDGTMTAESILSSTDSTTSKYHQQNINLSSNDSYTYSVYLKYSGSPIVSMTAVKNSSANTVWCFAHFNLLSGEVEQDTGEASMDYIGKGWYRCSIKGDPPSSGSSLFRISLTSVTLEGQGVLAFGGQVETGHMTSYIPTTGSSANRAATTVSNESEVSVDIKVWNGGGGYQYDRTNLLRNSDGFNESTWGKSRTTVISDNVLSPYGDLTADKAECNQTTSSGMSISTSASISLDENVALSVFIKKGNSRYCALGMLSSNYSNLSRIFFDLDEGTSFNPSTTGSEITLLDHRITAFSDGWYRISVSLGTSNNTTVRPFIYSVTGNGSFSVSEGDYNYLWGAQLEINETPTSIIPTTSSAVTELSYSDDSPISSTYVLSGSPQNGLTTFEIGELLRDYIDQTNDKNSGTVWAKITLSDGVEFDREYVFLATEGYLSSYEAIQTNLNAPRGEVLMQSNTNIIIPEGESLSVPIYAQYNSYYTKTTAGVTTSFYLSNSDDNSSQIGYVDVNSSDDTVKLYADSNLIETITVEAVECNKYNNISLMFVNKFGAKQEFFVNMKSVEKIKVKDNGFNRNVINYSTLSIDNGIHGYKRNVTESREAYTLNTPFLDEGNVQAFEELLLSEYVWMKKENSEYIPVTIKDNSMTRKTHLNDKLIQYTVNVESSFNLINNQR